MGYIRNECMVVTSDTATDVLRAHGEACQIFDEAGYGRLVSGIQLHAVNGGASFFVSPDGSKEGWEHSNKCSDARAKLIQFLKTAPVDWVLIEIGGDDGEYQVLESPNGKVVKARP